MGEGIYLIYGSLKVICLSPVGNDNGVVELAAAVLTQGGAPPIGDDSVGAVQMVETQVVGRAGPSY